MYIMQNLSIYRNCYKITTSDIRSIYKQKQHSFQRKLLTSNKRLIKFINHLHAKIFINNFVNIHVLLYDNRIY